MMCTHSLVKTDLGDEIYFCKKCSHLIHHSKWGTHTMTIYHEGRGDAPERIVFRCTYRKDCKVRQCVSFPSAAEFLHLKEDLRERPTVKLVLPKPKERPRGGIRLPATEDGIFWCEKCGFNSRDPGVAHLDLLALEKGEMVHEPPYGKCGGRFVLIYALDRARQMW